VWVFYLAGIHQLIGGYLGYHQTVLIIFRKKDEDDVGIELKGGIDGAISRLRPFTGPDTAPRRAAAEGLIQILHTMGKKSERFYLSRYDTEKAFSALFDVASAWKDARMWQQAMLTPCCTFSSIGKDRLAKALALFSFKSIEEGYEIHLSTFEAMFDLLLQLGLARTE
jgi:hypothetical protein